MTTQLDIDEVLASLPSRGTWQVENNRIVCEFRFPDFVQAFEIGRASCRERV